MVAAPITPADLASFELILKLYNLYMERLAQPTAFASLTAPERPPANDSNTRCLESGTTEQKKRPLPLDRSLMEDG